MTAREMKIKVFSLIEEYYPDLSGLADDEDVKNKINGAINQIQTELSRYRKINAYVEVEIEEDDDKTLDLTNYVTDGLYQIGNIDFGDDDVDYEWLSDTVIRLPKDYTGTFTVYYYKTPDPMRLTFASEEAAAAYDRGYTFENDDASLEIMPYGIASLLLKMDMISNYGQYFEQLYQNRLANLDTRMNKGTITANGGYDI